jgi:hypothetical protein
MILGFQLDRGIAVLTVNHEKHWQGDRLFSINLPVFLMDWLSMDCPKSPSTLISGLQKCSS